MNRRDFTPELEKCKFVDWQKVRLQESADEVPSGAMPRRYLFLLALNLVWM